MTKLPQNNGDDAAEKSAAGQVPAGAHPGRTNLASMFGMISGKSKTKRTTKKSKEKKTVRKAVAAPEAVKRVSKKAAPKTSAFAELESVLNKPLTVSTYAWDEADDRVADVVEQEQVLAEEVAQSVAQAPVAPVRRPTLGRILSAKNPAAKKVVPAPAPEPEAVEEQTPEASASALEEIVEPVSAVPAATMPKGAILPAEKKEVVKENAALVKAELLSEEDSFLNKVKTVKRPVTEPVKGAGWAAFKTRFLTRAPKEPKAKAEEPIDLPKGVIPAKKPEQNVENAEVIKAELLSEKDSFLEKVKRTGPVSRDELSKGSGWSAFKTRFFSRMPKEEKQKAAKSITEKELKEDGFLQRVQKKSSKSVVGTAMDDESLREQMVVQREAAQKETSGGLSEIGAGAIADSLPNRTEQGQPKGRILSAADLRKEAKESIEAQKRLAKDVEEIKREMAAREKELEKMDAKKAAEKPAEAPPSKVPKKHIQYKKKNGFQQLLASVSYIGLGKERVGFIQNLATMLNAGLPLIDALKTLQMETRAKPMKKLLQKILDAVENGSPLWRAMEAQSFFSLHALALIRIGEEAGNLAENIANLANQEEKDHSLKSKVKMAMIYPAIVTVLMFIIVMGLGMFVLPNLVGVLFSLNVPLPFITRVVIAFSNLFSNYGYIVVPGSIGGAIFIVILAKFTPLRIVFQWMMFRIPGIGRLAREATIARFGVILGGLLKAGVPVIDAMQSLVQVTPIIAYRNLYMRMLDHITIGDSFSKSFAGIKGSTKLLPPSVQQLVITGEKSGALADIMLKVADIYDKKASETAQKLPVILEPMLLLVIGGLVGTIAFAIIVPIYSIVGNVGR